MNSRSSSFESSAIAPVSASMFSPLRLCQEHLIRRVTKQHSSGTTKPFACGNDLDSMALVAGVARVRHEHETSGLVENTNIAGEDMMSA